MHPNPKRIVPVLVIIVIGAAIWWYFSDYKADATAEQLTYSGTIEAPQAIIAPELGGRVLDVLVDAGQDVQAGQELLRLEDVFLQAQRKQAQAALAVAQANYDLVAAGLPPEQRDLAVAAAQLEVTQAEQALDALKDTAALAAAQASQAVAAAEKQLDQATKRYDNLIDFAEENTVNELDLALAKTGQALAQAQLDEARRLYEKIKDGADPDQLELAEQRLATAQAKLAAAQSGPTAEQLALAQAQVEAAQAALQVVEAQMERLIIRAPASGVLLTRSIDRGEVVAPGASLMTLGQLDQLELTVFIPEDRYGKINLGDKAILTSDSFPEETFSAQVIEIADQAEFTPRNVQTADGRRTMVFAVKLRVENPSDQLKPGMPVDVTFEQ
jgi:HlyD family secretion protein